MGGVVDVLAAKVPKMDFYRCGICEGKGAVEFPGNDIDAMGGLFLADFYLNLR